MVIHNQLTAVAERYRINTGVWIRQRGQSHVAPGEATILRPDLKNPALFGAADRFKAVVFVKKDAGLDRADFLAVIDGRARFPGLAEIAGALKMNAPTAGFG